MVQVQVYYLTVLPSIAVYCWPLQQTCSRHETGVDCRAIDFFRLKVNSAKTFV